MTVPESAAAVFERVLGELRTLMETDIVREDLEQTLSPTRRTINTDGTCDSCSETRHLVLEAGAAWLCKPCADLDRFVYLVYRELPRLLTDARLATALAQPDMLGDGGGVVEQVKALREAAASARLMEADGWVPAWLEDRADALLTQPSATSERVGWMGERLTESERAVFLEEISKSYTHGWNCARAELLPLLDAERQRGDDLEAALAARGAGDGLAGRVAALADEFRGRLPFAFERRLHRLLDPDAQGADGGGWGVSRPIIPTLEDLDFLAQTGTGAIEAAKRVGFSDVFALEKWLARHGEKDLFRRLRRNDPETELTRIKSARQGSKTCTKCGAVKPLTEFYTQPHTKDGRASWCRKCNSKRERTPARMVEGRARGRAYRLLAKAHPEEFELLFEQETQRAIEEHERVAAAAEARGQADAAVARLKTGPKRREETDAIERLDVARCSTCHQYHDAGHPACAIEEAATG